jgi:hypothetical protein
VITVAVPCYLRYGLSYRNVEELLAERGVEVDHITVFGWVQRSLRCSPTPPDAADTLWVPRMSSGLCDLRIHALVDHAAKPSTPVDNEVDVEALTARGTAGPASSSVWQALMAAHTSIRRSTTTTLHCSMRRLASPSSRMMRQHHRSGASSRKSVFDK